MPKAVLTRDRHIASAVQIWPTTNEVGFCIGSEGLLGAGIIILLPLITLKVSSHATSLASFLLHPVLGRSARKACNAGSICMAQASLISPTNSECIHSGCMDLVHPSCFTGL